MQGLSNIQNGDTQRRTWKKYSTDQGVLCHMTELIFAFTKSAVFYPVKSVVKA